MGFYDHLLRDIGQILFPHRDLHAIPSLDGALGPNDALDQFQKIGDALPGLDDVVLAPNGSLYVSAGPEVLRLSGPDFATRDVAARFEANAGAIALHPDGRLLVCVSGQGLVAVAPDGSRKSLTTAGGRSLRCLTSIAVAADSRIFLTDGSTAYVPDDWCWDLMEKNHAGRLLVADSALDGAKELLGGLAYPNGLALSADGSELWYTEGWIHRVSRCRVTAEGIASPQTIIDNFPGYPGRLAASRSGGYWLSLFAMRTHLVELVLREDDFRRDMMRAIDPALWIAPALSSGHSYLEPLQGGGMRKLGILKPWAPPRSYGLVVQIDAAGELIASLHSRVGGHYHGITKAIETPRGLVVASKGSGYLLLETQGTRQ